VRCVGVLTGFSADKNFFSLAPLKAQNPNLSNSFRVA